MLVAPSRSDLTARLAEIRKRLDQIAVQRRELALAAVAGDAKARTAFAALTRVSEEQTHEAELTSLALEALAAQEAVAERHEQESRARDAAQRRERIIAGLEAEQRKDIQRMIERFKRQGDTLQVLIWESELAGLRQRLEQQIH